MYGVSDGQLQCALRESARASVWLSLTLGGLVFLVGIVSICNPFRAEVAISPTRMMTLDVAGAHLVLVDLDGDNEWWMKRRTPTLSNYGRRPTLDEAILGLGLIWRRPWGMVEWSNADYSGPLTYHTEMQTILRLPLWMPFFMLMIYPTSRAWRGPIRRLRRRRRNQCMKCGYNLTANISGTCPECGTPIPKEIREKLITDSPKP